MSIIYDPYKEHIYKLKDTGKYRKLLAQNKQTAEQYLDFSSNDYLYLSKNNSLLEAAITAGQLYGVGATGSRLLSGNQQIFMELEKQIAQDKQTESALVFNSGFQANLSVLSSLLDKNVLQAIPLVFFDKLNHSSLYQAAFLSGAELVRYQHNDIEHLSELLNKFQNDVRPKFIVTESIFGMDGDIAPLEQIAELAKTHQAFLYVDEAHATGIIGKNGYGLSTAIDLSNVAHIAMGTFSKALGCSGAYIACNSDIKDYLINKSPGFIYSTAMSPMIAGAAAKAWQMIPGLDKQRRHLLELSKFLRDSLVNSGFNIGNSTSHIVPIIFGNQSAAIEAKQKLSDNGIIVSCIRPPTVPPGTSRIRMALTSNHTHENILQLLNILKSL